jgi:hypothetical protein
MGPPLMKHAARPPAAAWRVAIVWLVAGIAFVIGWGAYAWWTGAIAALLVGGTAHDVLIEMRAPADPPKRPN